MTNLIGVVGWIGSGKGTVSDILVDEYGFEKLSFADSLKDAVSVVFGWQRNLLEGDTEESRVFREAPDEYWTQCFGYEVTPRKILQVFGTEACRDVFHQDIWVGSLIKKIQPNKKYVIADVRFPNEILRLRKHGGSIVHVNRGKYPEWYATAVTENTTLPDYRFTLEDEGRLMSQLYPHVHSSEWAWVGTQFDHVIYNDHDLQHLKKEVHIMMEKLNEPNT